MVRQNQSVQIIEWKDMKAQKFYSYGVVMSISTRTLIYPTQLIKTRFQAQSLSSVKDAGKITFRGAVRTIYSNEGFRGFYKGLSLNLMQVPVSYVYLTTFEFSKEKMSEFLEKRAKSNPEKNTSTNLILPYLFSGFIASSISQVVATPLDVVAQYKQVQQGANIKKDANIDGSRSTAQIFKQLYRSDGIIKGFYRGFTMATLFFGVHSGLIWAAYYKALSITTGLIPAKKKSIDDDEINKKTSNLEMNSTKASQIVLAGISSSLLTNICLLPMDTVRTRYQLQVKLQKNHNVQSIWSTTRLLYNREGPKGFFRGWQPRAVQSQLSGVLFLAYEYLKLISAR